MSQCVTTGDLSKGPFCRVRGQDAETTGVAGSVAEGLRMCIQSPFNTPVAERALGSCLNPQSLFPCVWK